MSRYSSNLQKWRERRKQGAYAVASLEEVEALLQDLEATQAQLKLVSGTLHKEAPWLRSPATGSAAGPQTMLKIEGRTFRCECGCNVFTKTEIAGEPSLYTCNSCETIYSEAP